MNKGCAALAAMVAGLALGASPAAAACSVEQRVELAKAGYAKAEIDEMCSVEAPEAAAPPPAASIEILQSATYDAATGGAAKRYFAPEQKCEFREDRVRINDRKGSGAEFPYEDFSTIGLRGHRFESKLRNGIVTAHIEITTARSGGKDACFAMLVRRRGVAAEEFDDFVSKKRQEFDAVLAGLRAKGVTVGD